jgi:hypothetical protein
LDEIRIFVEKRFSAKEDSSYARLLREAQPIIQRFIRGRRLIGSILSEEKHIG